MDCAYMSTQCYHCDLPVPEDTDYSVIIAGVSCRMCCPGCQFVAQTIIENGLLSYYQFRTEPASKPEALIPESIKKLSLFDDQELQKSFVHRKVDKNNASIVRATLSIEGITCAACSWLIEKRFQAIPGVVSVEVNLGTHQAFLTWDDSVVKLSHLLTLLSKIGYKAYPYQSQQQEVLQKKEFHASAKRLLVSGFGMMQVMSFALALYLGAFQGMAPAYIEFFRWVSFFVVTPIFFYSGKPFFASAWRGLKMKQLGMDLPVSLAIGSAYVASAVATIGNVGEVYFDSVCMFIFFLTLGRFLEMLARHRSVRATYRLQNAVPQSATLVLENEQKIVPAYKLSVGDTVLIKAGEIVPADGRIIEGASSVNESLLTGEQLPIAKKTEDLLIGGSQNIESSLMIRVTQIGDKTILSHILRILENAQRKKPPLVQLANKIASYFVGGILFFACIVAMVWWQIDPSRVFWITLSVLVITCPCALSLATPVALMTTHNAFTKMGLLLTRPHVIEGLSEATDIVFDKTGTLTKGELSIAGILLAPSSSLSLSSAIQIAEALEKKSEHPIAKAFLQYAREKELPTKLTRECKTVSNQGVEGKVEGNTYRIGKPAYVAELWDTENQIANAPDQDNLWVLLGDASGPLAWFRLVDAPREHANHVVSQLKKLGLQVSLLSGDASKASFVLAKQLGIKHVVAGATPSEKVEYIKNMQASGKKVIMIGDGVNDAPVLAAASISIAMGGGSDLAKTSGDAILLDDHLEILIEAIQGAGNTRKIIRQNLAWAVIYNLTALPLAACGLVAPYWAALGMAMSSLLVVLNALRLTRVKKRASVSYGHHILPDSY